MTKQWFIYKSDAVISAFSPPTTRIINPKKCQQFGQNHKKRKEKKQKKNTQNQDNYCEILIRYE